MKSVANVGFIGVGGFVSRHHLPAVAALPHGKVHAICDTNPEQLRAMAAQYDVPHATGDYRRILDDPEVDVVVIGTRQDTHARFIIESLEAGKWVLCEKPMAESDEDAARVLEAERAAPGRLAIGFNRRFAPSIQRLKRLMSRLEPPFFINYRLMWPEPLKQTGYYAERARMLYEGTHIIDLVCWLLGRDPEGLYMSGDPVKNQALILEFGEGSRLSFLCGSMGSYAFWKESLECFAGTSAVSISDFVDMRVRGLPGEFDEIFPCHLDEQAPGIRAHGFDFYEVCRGLATREDCRQFGIPHELVRRPGRDFGPDPYHRMTDYPKPLMSDKGWVASVGHFLQCFLDGTRPDNADGRAGALATQVALRAAESLERRQRLSFAFRSPLGGGHEETVRPV